MKQIKLLAAIGLMAMCFGVLGCSGDAGTDATPASSGSTDTGSGDAGSDSSDSTDAGSDSQ